MFENINADLIIIDGRASEEIIKNLKKLNIDIIFTNKCNDLYDGISYHPDIVIFQINRNMIIVAPNVYEYYKDVLKGKSIKIIKGEKILKRNYPNNIAYNVARLKGYALHNFKYCDEVVKFYLKKEQIELINVNQGYTKCSTAIIDEKSLITSDVSILKALDNIDIDVLKINEGYIDLPGLNYGFIGGTAGVLLKNKVVFTGTLDNHPDKDKIINFLYKKGKSPIFLSKNNLLDLGSLIPLNYN